MNISCGENIPDHHQKYTCFSCEATCCCLAQLVVESGLDCLSIWPVVASSPTAGLGVNVVSLSEALISVCCCCSLLFSCCSWLTCWSTLAPAAPVCCWWWYIIIHHRLALAAAPLKIQWVYTEFLSRNVMLRNVTLKNLVFLWNDHSISQKVCAAW